MIVIPVDDLREQYRTIALDVYSEGRTISPRGIATKELDNVALVFRSPNSASFPTKIGRNVSSAVLAAELMQILAGVSDLKQLDSASKGIFSSYSDDGRSLSGAYGPRTVAGLERCVKVLAADPSSRQATASLWNNYEPDSKDVPCTLSWSFSIRDNSLRMTTMMRSNDMMKGVAYDVPFMARIQSAMAWALDVPAGTYTHIAQSLHVYSTDVDALDEMNGDWPRTYQIAQPPLFDHLPTMDEHPLSRWARVRDSALVAMQPLKRTEERLPPSFEWYADRLIDHPGYPNFCADCRYFLPDEDFEPGGIHAERS